MSIVRLTHESFAALLPALLQIERRSFPEPWPAPAFLEEIDHPDGAVEALVQDGAVAGFCVTRRLYDELHLLQIATRPELRRAGIGAMLLRHVLTRAAQQELRAVLLEVRAGNHAAVRLYGRHGFAEIGRRRGYYSDTGEDALVMEFMLVSSRAGSAT